jgi:transposase-like protein
MKNTIYPNGVASDLLSPVFSRIQDKGSTRGAEEETTIAEIAIRFSIHPNQVSEWKRQAIEGFAEIFTGNTGRNDIAHEAQIKELHAKI